LSVPAVPWLVAEFRKIPEDEADKRLAVLGAILELPHHDAFELCVDLVRESPDTDRFAKPGVPTPATRAIAELYGYWRHRAPFYHNQIIELMRDVERRGMPDNIRAKIEQIESRSNVYY
jgi:hypothetical protein